MKHLSRFFGGLGLIFMIFGAVAIVMFRGKFASIGIAQFILGVIGVVIFLFHFVGDAMHTISRKREAIFGVVGAFVILLLLIGANVVAHSKLGERKFDLTVNKIHSLAPESLNLVKNLKAPVSVDAFLQDGDRNKEALKDLVNKYSYASDKITLNFYEPDREPAKVKEYDAHTGEIVVRNEKTKKSIKLTSLTEQDLTTAIRRVMNAETKTIYFTQGHGEGDLDDDKTSDGLYIAKYLLENEGFKVQPLNLAATPEIPKDASQIVMWGPQRPVSKNEVDTLLSYLERGGDLVVASDPLIAPTKDKIISTGLEPIYSKYGLEIKGYVMLENQIHLLQGRVTTLKLAVSDYNKQLSIVSRLGKESITEFSVAQPVFQADNFKDASIKRSWIANSSSNSWAESNIGSIFIKQQPAFDEKTDKKGPVPLGQAVEWPVSDKVKDPISKTGKLVVYGNASFGTNGLIQGGFNRDLVLNTFAYMGGEEESVTIRPKTWTASTLQLTPDQRNVVYYSSLFVIPELIMCLGMMIWLVRRSRA